MAIIISQNNQNARRIEESSFDSEDNLQEYVINNPEIIPLYDIHADARLFVAAREFSTQSGPIDALGFDAAGNIYIIETKMFRNADKRKVVAQALDYGASMWRHATDYDAFLSQLDAHTQKQFDSSFKDQYQTFFEMEDAAESIVTIKDNLSEGNIKFVVLMDSLDDRLKDLILYVNQNSKFDIYAVDFEYYKHDQFEIVIPKLYGSEVKKDVVSSSAGSGSRRKWGEMSYWQEVTAKLDKDKVQALRKLYDWSKSHADEISWGTGVTRGSFSPRFTHISPISFISVYTDGSVQVSYGYLPEDIELRKRLRNMLSRHVSVPGVTDLDDDNLGRWPSISPDYVQNHADEIIAALSDFVGDAS